MTIRFAPAALAIAVLAAPLDAAAQAYAVRGSCRDGVPHGVYVLAMPDGRVRVQGAFAVGKRTSSFLFWTSSGVRVAHLPYDDGVLSGTVALWYSSAPRGRDPQQKLEAAYAKGVLHGPKRSWYPSGKLRGEYAYESGTLVAAQAWSASGTPLPEAAARAQAQRDEDEDKRYYASLGAIVDAHLPACGLPESGTRT